MGRRRAGRVAALQALFGLDMRGKLGGLDALDALDALDSLDRSAAVGVAAAGYEDRAVDDDRGADEVALALERQFASFEPVSADARTFAADLCRGVVAHRERIDGLLAECSDNWRLERMSYVDRNVLRLAVFELAERPDVPAGVAINEAIELGKQFGSTESAGFINGVLDHVARALGR